MDFTIDRDAYLLADTVASLLESQPGLDGQAMPDASALRRHWSGLCEMGLPALMLPEPAGVGAGLLEATVVAERLGQHLVGVPAAPAIVLAAEWHRHDSDAPLSSGLLDGSLAVAFNPYDRLQLSDFSGGTVAGRLSIPTDAVTDSVIAIATTADGEYALVELSLDGLRPESRAVGTDVSRPTARVECEALVPAANLPVTESAARRLRQEMTVLTAAELVGGMSRVVADTVDFVTERQQFGRSVGSFQAIKHQLADMYTAAEQARAAVQFAAISVADDAATAETDTASVSRWVPRAAASVFETAIHLHGAMGFSWQLDVHLHLRRALAVRVQFGAGAR